MANDDDKSIGAIGKTSSKDKAGEAGGASAAASAATQPQQNTPQTDPSQGKGIESINTKDTVHISPEARGQED